MTKFSNAAQANPKIDFIYVTGSFVLQPQSIPAEYHKALYVAGSLTSTTLDAHERRNRRRDASRLPNFRRLYRSLVGSKKLNGETVTQYNCAPVAAMFKSDVNNPIWIDSNIMPADAAPPK